ncbi:hypothetical protein GGR92_004978 [Spirosoma lacussanchae]|uniref:conjugal transfer protein TraO n=1 Tax=Spirosoma lacussanchae TaxID=1884249 RepID=UPI00110836F6|nr:conjugal transfer protein TraO [Spirosoma lacussanchae]
MLKPIILWLALCLMSASTLAQTHLKGQRFIDVQGGVVGTSSANPNQLGMSGLISTGRYNRQYNAWKLSFSYAQNRVQGADSTELRTLRQFTVGWGYEFNLWRNPFRTRFIRATVQPVATYESLPSITIPMMTDSTCASMPSGARFLLGAEAGIEFELSPVVISLRQRWLPKSAVQPFYTLVSVGWRWHGR